MNFYLLSVSFQYMERKGICGVLINKTDNLMQGWMNALLVGKKV